MKTCCKIVFLFIVSYNLQSQWYSIGEQKLIKINVEQDTIGLIGGDGGFYLISEDKNYSDWREEYCTTDHDIVDIHKPNDSTLFLCLRDQYTGGPSQIALSSDNGINMNIIVNTSESLNDICCLNDSIFFYTGLGIYRYNLHTGITYSVLACSDVEAVFVDFYSIFFLDDTIGFATGVLGKRDQEEHLYFESVIMKTVDGGDNWSVCFKRQGIGSYRIKLCPGNLLVGHEEEGFSVIISNDLGETWVNRDVESLIGMDEGIYGAFFTSQDTGYVASAFYLYNFVETVSYNKIFKTFNGGETWNLQYIDTLYIDAYLNFSQERLFRDIYFVDDQTGFVAGNKILLRTDNAGGDDFIDGLYESNRAEDFTIFLDRENTIRVMLNGSMQDEYELKIYDMKGMLHYSILICPEQQASELTHLPNGIYMAEVKINMITYIAKFPFIRK